MSSDKSHRAMQEIWAKISRPSSDGKRYIHFKVREDIVYLYCTGFVDEKKYTLQQWLEAFEDSKLPNEMYMVNETQWMDKTPYRYSGLAGVVFDPMSIREGDWTEADVEKLIHDKILPAVYFTESQFRSIWNEARVTFYQNGVYRISEAVKQDLKNLMDMYPSPAQVRALGVLEAKLAMKVPLNPSATGKGVSTGYSRGPTPSQTAAQKLASILSKK